MHDDASAGGSGSARDLAAQPERLISAAGGFESLAAEIRTQQVQILSEGEGVDTGHDGLNDAISGFAQAWRHGVRLITDEQERFGDGLRKSVRDYLDVDIDLAYLIQVQTQGLDDT